MAHASNSPGPPSPSMPSTQSITRDVKTFIDGEKAIQQVEPGDNTGNDATKIGEDVYNERAPGSVSKSRSDISRYSCDPYAVVVGLQLPPKDRCGKKFENGNDIPVPNMHAYADVAHCTVPTPPVYSPSRRGDYYPEAATPLIASTTRTPKCVTRTLTVPTCGQREAVDRPVGLVDACRSREHVDDVCDENCEFGKSGTSVVQEWRSPNREVTEGDYNAGFD